MVTNAQPPGAPTSCTIALLLPRRTMTRRYLEWTMNNLLESGFSSVKVDYDGLQARDTVHHNRVDVSVENGLFRAHVRCEIHGTDAENLKLSLLRWHHDFVSSSAAAHGGWWHLLLYSGRWLVMVSVPLVATLVAWWVTHR
jgi:hypothetical protein